MHFEMPNMPTTSCRCVKAMTCVRQDEAPHQGDELLTALSPLLDEVDGLRGDEALHQETDNVVVLLEENARLRKLAVKLSNLLGDLPAQGT